MALTLKPSLNPNTNPAMSSSYTQASTTIVMLLVQYDTGF